MPPARIGVLWSRRHATEVTAWTGSRFRPPTGTGSTTAGCSATCAPEPASSGRASAASASSAPAPTAISAPTTTSTGSCSPPTGGRAGSASTRSRRSRSATSCPGRPRSRSAPPAATSACKFCQNWDISKSKEIDTLADEASPEAIARTADQLGCRSVAFTYNDPTIFLEYAIDTAEACHELGIRTVAVTAGYINPEPRHDFYRHLDAANVDLKAFTEEFYKHTAMADLGSVLDTIEYLHHETDVWFELTTLLIPGHNDSDAELHRMTQWVVEHVGPDVPMHFTAFHPDYKMLDVPPTPPATLSRARRIAIENGVRYAYTGNVHDGDGGSTFCHGCGTKVIERDWYVLGGYHLDDTGRCIACGTQIPGVFDGPAGAWGAKRLPVDMRRRGGLEVRRR